MTAQSGRGQGDQPLYEGVVLPANGDPWTPEQQRAADRAQNRPPAGQPWGEPWGPESRAAAESPAWEAGPEPVAQPWGPESEAVVQAPAPPPAPPQVPSGPPPQQAGYGRYEQWQEPAPYGGYRDTTPGAPYAQPAPEYQQPPQAAPPPPPPMPPMAPPPPSRPPAAARQATADGEASQALPPQISGALPSGGAPPPPADSAATQYLPPVADGPAPEDRLPERRDRQQPYARPQPQHRPQPGGDFDATQVFPPQPGGDFDATQMLPPQTGGDSDATQMLRSPLPPESPGAYGPGPVPDMQPGGGGYGQQPRPPAGFENLFRDDRSNEPGSTQSLPLFDHAAQQQSGGYGQPYAAEPQGRAARRNARQGGAPAGRGTGQGGHGGHGAHGGHGGHGGRRAGRGGGLRDLPPAVLIGAGIVVVALLGVAAGAMLAGGDEEKSGKVKTSQPQTEERPAKAPDPAVPQAKALDQLLNDSNNSRAAVIRSVESIKVCKKLDKASADLRAAAGQRNQLVTRLDELAVDKLPSGPDLKTSLASAWKASASADNHYAAWGDSVKGKKGCHKGKAKVTEDTAAGNRASGEATAAKKEAAGLWNPTAEKYGLKKRQFGQL